MATNEQFPIKEIKQTVGEIHTQQPFVTSTEVAERMGCTRETARQKLIALTEAGVLQSEKVGARAKVWYDPNLVAGPEVGGSGTNQPESTAANSGATETKRGSRESVSATRQSSEQTEEVLFFPSRREIVVANPTNRTQSILAQTAHLVDSNETGYLYKVDEKDVWNTPYDAFETLEDALKDVVGADQWDGGFESRIKDDWDRANQFRLQSHRDGFTELRAEREEVFEDVAKRKLEHNTHYTAFTSARSLRVRSRAEGEVKEALYEAGYPVIDERRLEEGASLSIDLDESLHLRDYQREWIEAFMERGSGVFAGPAGSGKTVAALGVMAAMAGETLIIVPGRELCEQWRRELIGKTSLRRRQIGLYHGDTKRIRPVTIATYSIVAMSRHRDIFNDRDWALVIADECHHSVASTWKRFRQIQSKARLGLSATPVREAKDPKEIFTLIGPPIGTDWGHLFAEDWVTEPDIHIIKVPWASNRARERYTIARGNAKMIEAARNPTKRNVIRDLLAEHADQKVLVFVDWIRQGQELASALNLPFVHGETDYDEREQAFRQFRDGDLDALIVSRIGDEGIDLPNAEVAILGSTLGSSRAQTGQRAGRTMRPFGDARVYILLTQGSGEEDWGRESTQYLAEKGVNVSKTEWLSSEQKI